MTTSAFQAESALIPALAQLDTHPSEMNQQRANLMLARIAWARIIEPGDGLAGTLIHTLGPAAALELFVYESDTANVRTALEAIHEQHGDSITERTLNDGLERWRLRVDRAQTIRDIERARAAQLRVLLPGDVDWPLRLDDLSVHAPTMLWVRGDPRSLSAPTLGVVGARAATGYGSHVTAELVDGACAAGFTIVSGAAYGIDAVAHRTALAASATTVAVLAGGVDRAYPKAHDSLLAQISQSGAVCSELIPGAAPTRWRFLQRNRLIAALSEAVLVPEAGVRSGSLNTAGHPAQV